MAVEFHNPVIIDTVGTISSFQTNRTFDIKSIQGVFLPEAKINFLYVGRVVHSLSIGNGLQIVGTNNQGVEKRLRVTLNGPDLKDYVGKTLRVVCRGFFQAETDEMLFKIQVQ